MKFYQLRFIKPSDSRINHLFFIFIQLFICNAVFSINTPLIRKSVTNKNATNYEIKNTRTVVGFIENKGQIFDQDFKQCTNVKYILNMPGLNLQLKSNSFSYDAYIIQKKELTLVKTGTETQTGFTDMFKEPAQNFIYKFQRIDIELLGANPNPVIEAQMESEDFLNYYNDAAHEQGLTNVRHFQKVIYRNIYPGIDLEFMAEMKQLGGVKYNFIIHPGADISSIKLSYLGALKTELVNGELSISTEFGKIMENIPLSYEIESGLERKVEYQNLGYQTYGFITKEYNRAATLLVDPYPIRQWGTYYGGNKDDAALASALDKNGNVFLGGYTYTTSSFATTGSHQTTIAGVKDAFLAKFNAGGIRQWVTYYGGNGDEEANTCAIDGNGNVLLGGYTTSSSAIATSGSHQEAISGLKDAFLAKFSTDGVRQWATYYGGSYEEVGSSCAIDVNNNIFLAGIRTGSYDDAFLVKFNSSGVKQWDIYYEKSEGRSCAVDGNGNVFLAGQTTNSSNIATTGTHQKILGGKSDAFLIKYNSSGVRQWGTYYGGSELENSYSCATDKDGNIFLTGYTQSTSAIATTASHQVSYGGGSNDGFIAKFNTQGVRQWGTYYGGSADDRVTYCVVDGNANLILAGITHSTEAISTLGAHQSSNGGVRDGFLAKFNTGGLRQWATYYGGSETDYANSCAVDGSSNVYLAGYTYSTSAISTAGSQQSTFGGGGATDAFLAKFTGSAGVSNNNNKNSFSVFPNPTKADIKIHAFGENLWQIEGYLCDMLGNKLEGEIIILSPEEAYLNLDGVSPGVYFLQISLNGVLQTFKIIKVKE